MAVIKICYNHIDRLWVAVTVAWPETYRGLQQSATQVTMNYTQTQLLWDCNNGKESQTAINKLNRNEKKQIPAETSDLWKTKSNGMNTIILFLPTVLIRIIS